MKFPNAALRTALRTATLPALGLSLLLSGCSANFGGTMSGGVAQVGPKLHGSVMGGRQPILGAHIFLYKAPSGGSDTYGSAATSVLVAPGTPGSQGNTFGSSAPYYALSGGTFGDFDISDDYSCAPSDQMYLLSVGGNPGIVPPFGQPAPDNQAAILMVALGACSTLSSSTNIIMNELTTIVAVTALQQFMTDATHVAAPSTNQQGLQNAFLFANQLINYGIGVPNGGTSTVSMPNLKIFTLGNVMAACVNSSGYVQGDTGACDSFFSAAVYDQGTSTTYASEPSDTVTAMLQIAHHPGANTTGLINLIPNQNVYGHSLTQTNDFSLPIGYLGGGLTQASAVALDINGTAYVLNCRQGCDNRLPAQATDDIVRIDPNGAIQTIGNGTINIPQGIALDTSNGVYVTNSTPSLSVFSPSGTLVNNITNGTTPALFTPEGVAIDPSNNAYVANAGNGNVQAFTADGTAGTSLTATGLNTPVGVAVDDNGNVVVTDSGASNGAGGLAVFAPAGGGTFTNTATFATGFHPTAVALDHSHKIWVVDPGARTVQSYDSTGATQQTTTSIVHGGSIQGLSIDGAGQVLVPSCASAICAGTTNDALFVLTNTGTLPVGVNGSGTDLSSNPYFGLQDVTLSNPIAVAVDGSGNAWVANANNGAVTVFVGIANPVLTPLSIAAQNSKIGAKP